MAPRHNVSDVLRLLTTRRGRARLLVAAARRVDPAVVPAPAAKRAAARPSLPPLAELSTSQPGSRVASGFFAQHPRFYETSETGPYRGRLNLRYEAIFAQNRDLFAGARVLDIASHDGRWSLAALSVGAAHVTGIEARPELVTQAEANLRAYDIPTDRFRFIASDIFTALADDALEFDVVMCLGFLYHTLRYNELLHRIAQTHPRYLVVDTEVMDPQTFPGTRRPLIHVRTEPVQRQGNAVSDELNSGERVLSGRPSLAGLRKMMDAYDYPVIRTADWGGLIRDNPRSGGVGDYIKRARVTVVGEHRAPEATPAPGNG